MADPGTLRTRLDIERRLAEEVPCPTCGAAIIGFSVKGGVVGRAEPKDRQTVRGQVALALTFEGVQVFMVPCGCQFDLDGKPVPHEVPC